MADSATKPTAKTPTLHKSVFGVLPENHELIKIAYLSYLANGRQNNAVTKTRGQVRGGGKKPWRQKGTGRARFGSIRNPIWEGGGIVFGPTGKENYTIALPKQQKLQALRQALSLKSKANKILIADVKAKTGKVTEITSRLAKLKAEGNVLIVVSEINDEILRATNNLVGVNVINCNYLNVFDVINSDIILISNESLEKIHTWLGEK